MTLPDVYMVPVIDGLEWVKNPVKLSDISDFEPFQCYNFPKPTQCDHKFSCRYDDYFSQMPHFLARKPENQVIMKSLMRSLCNLKF